MESKKMKIEVSKAEFDRIEEVIASTTANFIKELPQLIEKRLQGAVAKILGFENSWGEWRIDHCNGRMSVMSEYIGQKAKEAAQAAVSKLEFKPTKELQAAINKEFTDQFMDIIREQLRKRAEEHVLACLDKAIEKGNLEIETLAKIPTKKEMSDPAYGKRPMEKLIMETLVASKAQIEEEK